MKKSILIFVLTVALILTACSAPEVTPPATVPTMIPAENPTTTPETPDETPVPQANEESNAPPTASRLSVIYQKMTRTVELPEMVSLKSALVYDLTGIDLSQYPDSVYYFSVDNMLADEVVLITANDEKSAKEAEKLLKARLSDKATEAKGYSPEQYAIIQRCKVFRDGLEVYMIVSPKADELIKIYKELI